MKNKDLLIYRIATGLFGLMLLAGGITYFVKYEMTSEMFTHLGVPTEIIYPLAVAKILGVIAIWFIKNTTLKTLAYLGFALDLIFASITHIKAGDELSMVLGGPVAALVLLTTSYLYLRKINSTDTKK